MQGLKCCSGVFWGHPEAVNLDIFSQLFADWFGNISDQASTHPDLNRVVAYVDTDRLVVKGPQKRGSAFKRQSRL